MKIPPPKSTELKDEVSETSTKTTMDLPMNCEIFKCLKLPNQRKFIGGLGRGIYGMFGQKLLKKTKRIRNPHGNRFNGANTTATVAADGLKVSNTDGFSTVFAVQPFPIFRPLSRIDEFPGTILYYYEVKFQGQGCLGAIGLSGVAIPDWIVPNSNSYSIPVVRHPSLGCLLAGEYHLFELPEGAVEQEMKQFGNVYGCGLVLDPDNNLAIFFTLNGQLLGRKVSISPTVDRLFPAVTMAPSVSFEVNSGDDLAIPFEYDIQNCSGLGLACV